MQRHLTHLGPACWNFSRTDLAKLLIFYKDLNQRSIMESPANSVSGFFLGPAWGLQMCPSALSQGAELDARDTAGAGRVTTGQPGLGSDKAEEEGTGSLPTSSSKSIQGQDLPGAPLGTGVPA